MDRKLQQTIGWIVSEIEGIKNVLQKLAPNLHVLGSDVITTPTMPAGDAAPIQRAPRDPAASRAWADLPAMPRSLGAPPLVAPNGPFAAQLAAKEPPPPILAPLSNGRSLEAPRGLVVGVARPTQAPAGSALPPAVQRAPLGGSRRFVSEATLPDLDEAVDGFISPESPTPSSTSGSTSPGRADMASPSIRRLAVTEPGPGPSPLTRAPEPRGGAPLVGKVGQPSAAGRGASLGRSSTVSAAVQRAPSDVPTATSTNATPGAGRSTPPAGATVAGRPDGPRLTIGQARRLGLGAPLGSGPVQPGAAPMAGVQRGPLVTGSRPERAAPSPSATSGIQRAPAEPLDLPLATGHQADDGHDHAEDDDARLQRAPLESVSTSAVEPVVARPLATQAEPGIPTRRPPEATPSPLVSARPLRAAVQRAPLTLPAKVSDEASGAAAGTTTQSAEPSPPGNVKIHRGTEAAQLAAALDARSFTHQGEIFMPDSHGPLTAGKGRALLAHELTHVGQQRRLGRGLPPEHTPAGRALEAEAVAAERSPDMTLAGPRGGSRATAEAAAPATPIAASTEPFDGPTPSGKTLPQRAPIAAPESRTGRGHASPGQGRSEQDLEVLAHQLYQRIGRHLRRELLVDRERSGFALDLP